MRKGDQVSAALFFMLGLLAIWEASKLTQSEATVGPGPGLLPSLLGVAMCVLALILFVRSTLAGGAASGAPFLPSALGRKNIACIVGGLAVYLLLLEPVGYLPMTAVFAAFLLWSLERHRWRNIIAISLAVAILGYGVFAAWLRVPLPRGVLAYLGLYF